jgi:hypothetical protein
MNIDEVKTTIGRGDHLADEARTTMAAVHDDIAQAQSLSASAYDSQHAYVMRGHRLLKEAETEAQRVSRLLSAGVEAADSYRGVLG